MVDRISFSLSLSLYIYIYIYRCLELFEYLTISPDVCSLHVSHTSGDYKEKFLKGDHMILVRGFELKIS